MSKLNPEEDYYTRFRNCIRLFGFNNSKQKSPPEGELVNIRI